MGRSVGRVAVIVVRCRRTCLLTHSLTYSLTHSLTHPLPYTFPKQAVADPATVHLAVAAMRKVFRRYYDVKTGTIEEGLLERCVEFTTTLRTFLR